MSHRQSKHRQPLTPEEQAAGNDYIFGWRACVIGTPYSGMHGSDDIKAGWMAAWMAAKESPTLTALREVVQQ